MTSESDPAASVSHHHHPITSPPDPEEVKDADGLPVGISNEDEKLESTGQVEGEQKAETDVIATTDLLPQSAAEVKEAETSYSLQESIEEEEALGPPRLVEADSLENTEGVKQQVLLQQLAPPSQVKETETTSPIEPEEGVIEDKELVPPAKIEEEPKEVDGTSAIAASEAAAPEEETHQDQVAEPLPETDRVAEGEQVKDIVKEHFVEAGKYEGEAKNHNTQEEQEIENASPTDGSSVEQEQEKVKPEDTVVLSEEVADKTLHIDSASRDVDFAPEANQKDLSEPASGEKDAVAEEHKECEPHGEPPQSKHKHSHNLLLSKLKQSLVKAKKAILGKHPKTTSSVT